MWEGKYVAISVAISCDLVATCVNGSLVGMSVNKRLQVATRVNLIVTNLCLGECY